MSGWKVEWTGRYPCLCSGEWRMYRPDGNQVPLEDIIFNNIEYYEDGEFECYGTPANTYNTYSTWHFENWLEVFEDKVCGYEEEEWIEKYKDWLVTIAPEKEWSEIFEQFQKSDWIYGSCGGCI